MNISNGLSNSISVSIDKKRTTVCLGCGSEIKIDHGGIVCLQAHDICKECSLNFISYVFEDPENMLPPKCSLCNAQLKDDTFVKMLNKQQTVLYMQVVAKNSCA